MEYIKRIFYKRKKLLFLLIFAVGIIYLIGSLFYTICPKIYSCPNNNQSFVSPTPSVKAKNNIRYLSDTEIPQVETWPIYQEESDYLTFRYRPDMTIERLNGNTFSIKGFGAKEMFIMTLNMKHDVLNEPLSTKYAEMSVCYDVRDDPYFKGDLKNACIAIIKNTIKSFTVGQYQGVEFDFNPYEDRLHGLIFKTKELIIEIILRGGETGSSVSDNQISTAKEIIQSLKIYPKD